MFRKLLLPMLATAALAGCATDYGYRNGNGDYYYGQPRVEYNYPNGYFGEIGLGYGYGGFGASYYYDRFGRLVYGIPGGYYNSPYYGGNGWYRPRPHKGHGDRDHHDDDHRANNTDERPPPWRDLGGLQQRDQNESGDPNRDNRERPMRRPRPASSQDAPMRPQRSAESAPVIRERGESSSRMGGFIDRATRNHSKHTPAQQE